MVDELAVTTAVPLEDDDEAEEVVVFDNFVEDPTPTVKKEKRRKKEGTDSKFKDLTNEPRRKSPPIGMLYMPIRDHMLNRRYRRSTPYATIPDTVSSSTNITTNAPAIVEPRAYRRRAY